MRPAWLARMLVWAGVLLFVYWGILHNHREGAAFSVGLMLGAGTLLYNGRPRVVPLMVVLAVGIGAVELFAPWLLKNRAASPEGFFTGYLMGLLSPFIAWRLSGSESPR